MTQPEALRLAEFYEALAEEPPKSPDNSKIRTTAAELRRLAKVEAQRDALLEALKRAADFLHHATEFRFGHPGFEQTHAKARAAIKAVEESK